MSELAAKTPELPQLCLPSVLSLAHRDVVADPVTVSRLVASGICPSKAALTARTVSARSAVTASVDRLLRRNLLEVSGWVATQSGRGRPAERLVVRDSAGLVGCFDAGATGVRVTLATLSQKILGHVSQRWDVAHGPDATLKKYAALMKNLLEDLGPGHPPLEHVVLGLPTRYDVATQRPVRPTIMPGWDGYPVCEQLEDMLGAPVAMENDTNLRALGEASAGLAEWLPIMALKVGTGIGGSLIDTYGHLYHGFRGAAGEIGHIPVADCDDTICSCGSIGCVEANASIPAMIRHLARDEGRGYKGVPEDIDVLMRDLRASDPATLREVRAAGERIGNVVAILLNVLNPRRVVIDCPISEVSDEFLAGIRTRAYEHARPLATREVMISYSVLGDLAGVAGGIALAIDSALARLAR